MFRALLAGMLISFASAAYATPVATLSKPTQTIYVPAGAVEMLVYYAPVGDTLEVTMLFTDPEGELLRSRVKLVDGQSHSVAFSDEEGSTPSSFRVERVGRMIGIHVEGEDAIPQFAADGTQRRSKVK